MELGAQELEEVEGLQETLAEDLESHQESQGGKRDAEEVHVGTPTKKRKYAGQGEVKCDHCEKKYSSKNSLAAHLKKFHVTIIKKELVVESSGESSIDDVALDESNIINITNGETVESMVELEDSMNSNQEQSEEQEVKKFDCDLCDKTFVTEQGRRTHKTRKHGSDQPLLLACEFQDCALAFIKNSELRKHEIAMHNRVPRSKKSKNAKKEPTAGSVFAYNSSEEMAAEEESDVDTSVVEAPAEDITTENKANAEECEDSIDEGEPEEASITEAEDTNVAEDIVNMVMEDVTEDITAKYQDVPADSDTSMDLADVAAVEQENGEVIKNYNITLKRLASECVLTS